MSKFVVDLNCDLGESFGIYRIGEHEAILSNVTSANIACGFHAGDPHVMKHTVVQCLERGIRIGAHPGLPDLQGFGRRYMQFSREEAYDWTVYQIGALHAFVASEGGVMQHVKPHGALYNIAAVRRDIAEGIAEAVSRVHAGLIIYGPPGSELLEAAQRCGLKTAAEAFADRRYAADGTLAPRSLPGAVLENDEEAAEQALTVVRKGTVNALDGTVIRMNADTICLHGDGEHAAQFAAAVRGKLEAAGVTVRAFR